MRIFAIVGFLMLSLLSLYAQEGNKWRNYIRDEVGKDLNEAEYYLVEFLGSQKAIDPSDIIKRIDAHHFIITGRSANVFDKIWSVNDAWKLSLDDRYSLNQFYLELTDFEEISKVIDDRGITLVARYGNIIQVKSTLEAIKGLMGRSEIRYITNRVGTPKVEARVIDLNLNPNRINRIHHEFPLLDGQGELVSVQENRFRSTDIDLTGREVVSGEESELMDNHADEMATIIAGAGNSFVTGRGVASHVQVTSANFDPVLPKSNAYYTSNNIITQNHSYGIPQDGVYGAQAVAFDQSSFDNKGLLHVFSSGNEGQRTSEIGQYSGLEGYANLTGTIKMTKNSLVVGSVDTVGNSISFASRGPAYDGRVKPEVVAYSMVGSSNSAALVSGVAVLLQQSYREETGEVMPSALVKAMLINSAEDVGAEGLDYITGYGSINAFRSLQTLKQGNYFSGSVVEGDVQSFDLSLPANAVNLKVTLCWTDPPANTEDYMALINDLDVRLVDASLNVTLPWVLDPTPTIESLSSAALRKVDTLNNTEQITVTSPVLNYSIEVEGKRVAGSQTFYLTYQYDIADTFEWDFPTGSDNMPYNGESGSYFRWNTTKEAMGSLEFTIDGGVSWTVLDPAVNLIEGFWRWNSPPLDPVIARARMVVGAEIYETEDFTLSGPLNASVGFNCGDSLMLRWDPVPNAIDYTISSMGTSYLEPYQTTSDTFLVVENKSGFSTRLFSIQPHLSGGKNSLPAPTLDYAFQGIDCYVFSLFQTVVLGEGIYINLTLGTTYGIDSVLIQRNEFNEGYLTIEKIVNPTLASYRVLDDDERQGYNEHQVVIYFQNGETATLTAGASFYLTEIPIKVFPNPVPYGGVLDIITKDFEDSRPGFELIDSKGSVIRSGNVEGTQDFIELYTIDPGVYYYRLFADGKVYTERIIIQ